MSSQYKAKSALYSSYFAEHSELIECIEPLLDALGWHGNIKSVLESFPHMRKSLTTHQFIKTMNNLGFLHFSLKISTNSIEEKSLPCLFISNNNEAYILINKNKDSWSFFDPKDNKVKCSSLSDTKGTMHFFKKEKTIKNSHFNIIKALKQQKTSLFVLFSTTFLGSIISLSIPLFIMLTYDKVILIESYRMSINLLLGMLILISGGFLLSQIKSKTLNLLNTEWTSYISKKIFKKIICLPSIYIESASIGSQVSQLKELESIKSFISGPVATIIIELPFVILSVLLIFFLGGSITLIPIGVVTAMIASYYILYPKISKTINQSLQTSNERHSFLVESLWSIEQIKSSGLENVWINRYKKISSKTCASSFKMSVLMSFLNSIFEACMTLTALLVISIGISAVINQQLSVGALIALMMIIWKVLTPIKMLLLNVPKIHQFKTCLVKIDTLLNIPSEVNDNQNRIVSTYLDGNVKYSNVCLRYQKDLDIVLNNISFEAKKGELVVITGSNGAGKSTILKSIIKLYHPQSGTIEIDEKDIRQIDPIELRQAVGYLAQRNQFFYGTIEQNLKLSNPVATDEDIIKACKWANIYHEIMSLNEKFDTRIRDNYKIVFSNSFLQRLALARVLVKMPSILLLDEPTKHLDKQSKYYLYSLLKKIKGNVTVILVTHEEILRKIADKIFYVDKGKIVNTYNLKVNRSDLLRKNNEGEY